MNMTVRNIHLEGHVFLSINNCAIGMMVSALMSVISCKKEPAGGRKLRCVLPQRLRILAVDAIPSPNVDESLLCIVITVFNRIVWAYM